MRPEPVEGHEVRASTSSAHIPEALRTVLRLSPSPEAQRTFGASALSCGEPMFRLLTY
jgi:hypothetical protein